MAGFGPSVHSMTAGLINVRFGSKPAIPAQPAECQLCANSGHFHEADNTTLIAEMGDHSIPYLDSVSAALRLKFST